MYPRGKNAPPKRLVAKQPFGKREAVPQASMD
jgi:hypothetical protein